MSKKIYLDREQTIKILGFLTDFTSARWEWLMVGSNYGDEICPFCGTSRDRDEDHKDSCLWKKARDWLDNLEIIWTEE